MSTSRFQWKEHHQLRECHIQRHPLPNWIAHLKRVPMKMKVYSYNVNLREGWSCGRDPSAKNKDRICPSEPSALLNCWSGRIYMKRWVLKENELICSLAILLHKHLQYQGENQSCPESILTRDFMRYQQVWFVKISLAETTWILKGVFPKYSLENSRPRFSNFETDAPFSVSTWSSWESG